MVIEKKWKILVPILVVSIIFSVLLIFNVFEESRIYVNSTWCFIPYPIFAELSITVFAVIVGKYTLDQIRVSAG